MNHTAITEVSGAGVPGGHLALRLLAQRGRWQTLTVARHAGRSGVVVVCGAAAIGIGAAMESGPSVATGVTAAVLLLVTVSDVRERQISKRVVYPATLAVGLALFLTAAAEAQWALIGAAAVGYLATVAALTVAWLLRGVGFGDVRLAGLVALTAGWHGGAVSVAMWWWIAVTAAVVAVLVRLSGRRTIPLAPAIAAGWAVALVGVA